MTPWELAKVSEHSQQRALFAWANCVEHYGFAFAQIPDGYDLGKRERLNWVAAPWPHMGLLFAIHNQGHGDAIRGARAKAEGVKKGIPDIMLPIPVRRYAGLFIELKKTKAGVLSEEQKTIGASLALMNYRVELGVKGWVVAANIICDYLGIIQWGPNE